MPRLNSRGDLAAGVGGDRVSLWLRDKPAPRVIASNAGGACFLADDLLLYQQGAHLDVCQLWNGEIVTLDSQGAFELAAGGGVYAAKFTDGVRISNHPASRFIGNGVGDVGPDGDVLLKDPDGTFQGQLLADIQALGDGHWSALDRTYTPTQSAGVLPIVGVTGPVYGLHRHGDFCVYLQPGVGVIVRYLDQPIGLVLAQPNAAYRPDLVRVGDDLIVAYAEREGEDPLSLRRFVVPVADLIHRLDTPAPIPVPVPVPIPVPEPRPMPTLPDPGAVKAALDRELAPFAGRKMTNDEMGLACNNVALQFRDCGLHAKPPGAESNATLPDGRIVNRNVIRYHPVDDPDFGWWADVLGGAGTGFPVALAPSWERGHDDRRSFVPAKSFNPQPVPPPVKPPIDITTILAVNERCDAIDTSLENAHAKLDRILARLGA
jgi:hypothetical protein